MISKLKLTGVAVVLLSISVASSCTPKNSSQGPYIEFTATVKPTITTIPTLTNIPVSTITPDVKTVIFEESTSPNTEWTGIITMTTQGENKDLLFKVFNNSTQQELIVEEVDIDEIENPPPGGFFYPYIFKWSQDNTYLYYSYLPNFNDGCFGYFEPGGLSLKRLDLSNGEVVTIREGWATWMTFSPDEKRLAYIDTFGGNVSIIDIQDGKEQTFSLPTIKNELGMTTDTSDMHWSPDGKSLIYAHYVGKCDLLVPYSYIIQLYPDTNQQTILVDHDEHGYVPIEWNIQDKILLRNNESRTWWFNPITKEITPAQ